MGNTVLTERPTTPAGLDEAMERLAAEMLGKEPEHTLLPLPSARQAARQLLNVERRQALVELMQFRREAIVRAQTDPLRHELEPVMWGDVRRAIYPDKADGERIRVAMILGGNRSSKSRMCGKLVVEALVNHPGSLILCVSEDETASRETQQKIIWHYLPPEIKAACHNKRDRSGLYYVNYSEANGFSERKLVLPLPRGYQGPPSKLLFATYGEQPDDYEGLEFGHPQDWTIGWWADENLRLGWLQMFRRRGRFRPGTGLWSYTPIHGMTPTIKEAVGAAVTLEHRPSRLLPDRVNVPGLPAGTMPYVQKPQMDGGRVWYFHSEMSPFGPGPNGSGKPYAQSVAEDCAGKPAEYVQKIAYGYTRDTIGRAFPKYGAWNVVKRSQLPERGTNYLFMDPAGTRNWSMIWVRVTNESPPSLYIYRDWPDQATYGEWAVATERPTTADSSRGWDGDPGPAQIGLGYGVSQYKEVILNAQRIAPQVWNLAASAGPEWAKLSEEELAGVFRGLGVVDPMHVRQLVRAIKLNQGVTGLSEVIAEMYVDPRAARSEHLAEAGGTCALEQFLETQVDPGTGRVIGPPMELVPASGVQEEEGIMAVNELLDWNQSEPLVAVLNQPHLFVCEDCHQVRWMFENYTGRAGAKGACKDFADLARYMALAQLEHQEGVTRGRPGRGF